MPEQPPISNEEATRIMNEYNEKHNPDGLSAGQMLAQMIVDGEKKKKDLEKNVEKDDNCLNCPNCGRSYLEDYLEGPSVETTARMAEEFSVAMGNMLSRHPELANPDGPKVHSLEMENKALLMRLMDIKSEPRGATEIAIVGLLEQIKTLTKLIEQKEDILRKLESYMRNALEWNYAMAGKSKFLATVHYGGNVQVPKEILLKEAIDEGDIIELEIIDVGKGEDGSQPSITAAESLWDILEDIDMDGTTTHNDLESYKRFYESTMRTVKKRKIYANCNDGMNLLWNDELEVISEESQMSDSHDPSTSITENPQ